MVDFGMMEDEAEEKGGKERWKMKGKRLRVCIEGQMFVLENREG